MGGSPSTRVSSAAASLAVPYTYRSGRTAYGTCSELREILGRSVQLVGIPDVDPLVPGKGLAVPPGQQGAAREDRGRVAQVITSLAATCATPQQLLAWNRGHWAIESKNHHRRDRTLCEDACMARSGFSPANRATCNNIVLALILHHRRWDNAAQALRYFTLRRSEAFKALLAPG